MTTVQVDPPGDAQPTLPGRSLKSRTLNAGSWTLAGFGLSQALRLGSSLVMTRLLAPEMFGIMTIAIMIQVIVALLSDIGLRQAIIQSPRGNEPVYLNTAWSLQVLRGWTIWAVCLAVSAALYFAQQRGWVPAGSVYAQPVLPFVVAATTFASAIAGFQSTRVITANRDLLLKRTTLIDLGSQITGLLFMTVLGYLTRSIWAIVVSGLIAVSLSAVLSHLLLGEPRNRFMWDRTSVREIIGFGRWIFISSIFSVLAMNGDRLLLGAWVGADTLAFYAIALTLATVVEGLAYKLFGTVSLPVLSEVARNTPERLRSVYYRMRLPADLAFIFSAGFLYAAGQWIIVLLYDPRYESAGWMLQMLSFGLLFTRYSLTYNAFIALGRPQYQTVYHVAKLCSMFALLFGLYHFYGMPGAVAAVALHLAPTVPLAFWFGHKHKLNDFRFELAVLGAWPVGYGVGWAVASFGGVR